MPTKNIECQLAQGQIGRYLNGDRFSDEAVRQLESHISECDECTALLAERKKAVMAMLGEVTNARAAVHMDKPSASATDKLMAVLAKNEPAPKRPEVEPSRPKPTFSTFFPKPVLYCGGLALVLMGMSYFSRGALKAFGPTASETLAGDTNPPAKVPSPTKLTAPTPAPTPTSAGTNPAPTSTGNTTAPATAATTAQAVPSPTTTKTPTPLERVAPPTPAAARSVPSSSKPTPPTPKPKATPAKVQPKAAHKLAAKPLAHTVTQAIHPATPAHRSMRPRLRVVAHRLARQPRWSTRFHVGRRRLAPRPLRSGVRVYDAQGRPLR